MENSYIFPLATNVLLSILTVRYMLRVFAKGNDTFHPQQVHWLTYLARLRPADSIAVMQLCERLEAFANEIKMPFAVVAVGSVLNPRGRQPYHDVDLLLVPLQLSDKPFAEEYFHAFVRRESQVLTQERRVAKRTGTKIHYHFRTKETIVVRQWYAESFYEWSSYYSLCFPGCSEVQIFIRKQWRKITLREFIQELRDHDDPRRFAFRTFFPT